MRLDLTLITGPTKEPVTVEQAKLHCRVDGTAEDTLIDGLITAARQYVEEVCGRALITQTWEMRLDAWPAMLFLPRPRLLAVSSVTYVDDDGASATLDAAAYQVRTGTEPGCVLFDSGLLPAVTLADMAGVRVRYSAGYGAAASDVPVAIYQALLLLIGHWYANREAVAVGSMQPLPMAVDALLAPYRVHWFGEWVQ